MVNLILNGRHQDQNNGTGAKLVALVPKLWHQCHNSGTGANFLSQFQCFFKP